MKRALKELRQKKKSTFFFAECVSLIAREEKKEKKRKSKQENFPHSRNSCPLKCSTDELTVIFPDEASYQTKITFPGAAGSFLVLKPGILHCIYE